MEAINSYYEDQYHKQFSLIGDESLVQYCKTMEDFIVFVTRLPNLPLVVQGADDDDDWLRLTQGDLRDKATALKANPTQERLHDLILEILRPFQQQPVHNRHPMANFVKFACHKPGGGYLKVSEIVHLLVHLIHCARLAIFHQLTLHTQEDQREDILQMIRIRFGFFFFFFFPALVFTFLLGLLTISFYLSFFLCLFFPHRPSSAFSYLARLKALAKAHDEGGNAKAKLEFIGNDLTSVLIGGNIISVKVLSSMYRKLLAELYTDLANLTFGKNITTNLAGMFEREDLGNDRAGFTTVKNHGAATMNRLWTHPDLGKTLSLNSLAHRKPIDVNLFFFFFIFQCDILMLKRGRGPPDTSTTVLRSSRRCSPPFISPQVNLHAPPSCRVLRGGILSSVRGASIILRVCASPCPQLRFWC